MQMFKRLNCLVVIFISLPLKTYKGMFGGGGLYFSSVLLNELIELTLLKYNAAYY